MPTAMLRNIQVQGFTLKILQFLSLLVCKKRKLLLFLCALVVCAKRCIQLYLTEWLSEAYSHLCAAKLVLQL